MSAFNMCPYCGSEEFNETEFIDDMSWVTKYTIKAVCAQCKKEWYSDRRKIT